MPGPRISASMGVRRHASRRTAASLIAGSSGVACTQHAAASAIGPGRVRIRLAQYARDSQASFLAEAANCLAPLLINAEEKGWDGHVIEILLLQALLALAQGKRAAAHTLLTRALTLAEPAGYVRLFVEEGEALRFLILDFGLHSSLPPNKIGR